MQLQKVDIVQKIDQFFDRLNYNPEAYSAEELVTIVEAIIPVHATMEIDSYDNVDTLLAIYPYLFQKMAKIYAFFAHQTRIYSQKKDTSKKNDAMACRDSFENLMRAVRLQYEALSRRITIHLERRT